MGHSEISWQLEENIPIAWPRATNVPLETGVTYKGLLDSYGRGSCAIPASLLPFLVAGVLRG